MKKTLLTILSMVLCLSMQAAVTLDFTTNTWDLPTSSGDATTSGTYTDGTYSITIDTNGSNGAYYSSSNKVMIMGKTNATLTLPAMDFDVEKIVIVGGSSASTSVVQNIYVGDVAVSTQTTGAQGTMTYEIDSSYQTADTQYVLKVTSNHNTQIATLTFYGVGEEGDGGGGTGHGYEADDPFSVSEVIALAETLSSSDTVTGVYVKGIVSEIGSFYSDYGDLNYYISDDGTTTNQFYIYNGYYLDGEKFTSADQIKVSDTVIVTGDLTNYNGTTPELARGSKIVSIEEGDGDGDTGGSDGSVSASGSILTLTNEGVTVGTETATIDFTTLGLSNEEEVSGRAFELSDGSTVTFDQNGGSTSPKYYDVNTAIRAYALNTATFSASKQIAKIEMTCASSSYTGNTTATVEFTETGAVYCNYYSSSSGGTQLRVQSLVVYYAEEGDGDTGGSGDHEGDYLTPEIMGFNLTTGSSKQDITYDGAPSGTEYEATCYVGTGDYYGDFNISAAAHYLRNNTSVGYLRKLIIEPDENYTSKYVLPVRVSHEPYTGSDWSAFSSYGEEVAKIVVKEGGTVEIEGDYEYFAVGTANFATEKKQFKSIELIWETEGASATHEVTFDPESGTSHSELSEFTVICEDGLGFNEKNAISITRDGEELDIYVNAWEITDGTKTTMDFSTDEWGEEPTSLTEAGEYVITIPAKFFILGSDEVESKALTVTYIIEESSDTGGVPEGYIIDPEDGSTIESLYKINVAYDGGDVTVDSSLDKSEEVRASFKVVNDATGETVATIDHYEGVKDDNGYQTYDIYFTDEITTSGTYTVTIPASVFYDPDYAPCLEFYLHYTVEPKSIDGYYFTPADGKTVESLYTIKVEHESGSMGAGDGFWDDAVMAEFKVVNDATGETVATLDNWEMDYDEEDYHLSWVVITLSDEITATGTYTVTIPEGVFCDYSSSPWKDSPEFTLHYTIEGDVYGTFDYTVDPVEGEVESLQVIKLFSETLFWGGDTFYPVFDGTVSIYKDGDSEPYATTTNIGDEYDYSVAAWAPAYLIITFGEAITEGGDYEVVIPAGTFLWYNDEDMINNEEIRLSYTVKEDEGTETGINGFSINGENVEGIYSVGGQKLNTVVKGVNIVRYNDGSVKKIYVK